MKAKAIGNFFMVVCFLVAASAVNVVFAQQETTVVVTTQQSVELTFPHMDKLNSIQQAAVQRVLRDIRIEMAQGIKTNGDNNVKAGEVVVVKYGNLRDKSEEPFPLIDDDDNRVKVTIKDDGEIEYEYYEDDDASGVVMNYDEDEGEVEIYYDYVKRTLPSGF